MTKQPIKCWGFEGDHMYKEYPHKEDKMRIVQNLKKSYTMEDMRKNVLRIYVSLDNRHTYYQSHIIEVEVKIDNQPITTLIDSIASYRYLDPNMVYRFKLKRHKHQNSWLVHLATGTKRRVNELVQCFPLNINGFITKVYLNIISLGSYEFLISMDRMDNNHAILYFYNKDFRCLDEEGNLRRVEGIPSPISVKESFSLKPKIIFRKGCQIYATHMEEEAKDEVSNIEYYLYLKEY
jgi:hypothetical protein